MPCCGSRPAGWESRVLAHLLCARKSRPTCNQPPRPPCSVAARHLLSTRQNLQASLQPKHNRSLKGGSNKVNNLGVCLQVSVLPVFTLRGEGEPGQARRQHTQQGVPDPPVPRRKLSRRRYTGPHPTENSRDRTARATEHCWQQKAGKGPTHRS